MEKRNKIFIKIQLEKNEDTGELVMKTRFDPSAPNFFQDKDEISWCPNLEEIDFIIEAVELLPTHKGKILSAGHHIKPEDHQIPELEKTDTSDIKPQEYATKTVEKPPQPPEPVVGKKMDKTDSDGIIIKADSAAVDEIIKKKRDGDGVIVEADEDTIVERVLKHKKKGNW